MQISLRIKKEHLDEIVAGTKKIEYRAFTDFYISRLANVSNGEITSCKRPTSCRLYVGNNPSAPYAVVEVKEVELCQYMEHIPQGAKKGDIAFEIHLGNILESNYF